MAVNLSLYAHTPILQAFQTQTTIASDFFESDSWTSWKEAEEAKLKIQSEQIKGANAIIRSINNLAKSMRFGK